MTKVLVIEDEPVIRENIIDLLGAENFDAIGAEDGAQGMQLARDQMPDLILCDVLLPQLDGYHVIQQLQQDPATTAIPYIFITAEVERPARRGDLRIHASDYLAKPFTRNELLAAINTRLNKSS
jgi:CheY-like chemotaxis protein